MISSADPRVITGNEWVAQIAAAREHSDDLVGQLSRALVRETKLVAELEELRRVAGRLVRLDGAGCSSR